MHSTVARGVLIGVWIVGATSCIGLRPSRVGPATRERCLAALREGVRSDDFWPSIHAAEGLTLAGHGDEVRGFLSLKLATEDDDQKRCGIIRELVRAGERAKAALLLGILDKQDPHGHVHAAESLYKIGEVGDGKLLRQAMAQRDNLKLQLMAAAALGKAGDAGAMRMLREKLLSEDPEVARIAAWVLARIGDRSDIEQLRRNIERFADPFTRCYAEHALAALGDPEGRRTLLRNLRSDDPRIRTYAATFAGDARMTEAIPTLVRLLDDPHLDARIRAAQSLLVLSRPGHE